MNAQLRELLAKHNATFCWLGEYKTWCIQDNESGIESPDYEADSKEDAELDAIDYLVEYHED